MARRETAVWGKLTKHPRAGHGNSAGVALADADPPGAERLEPVDLGGLVGWAKIYMELTQMATSSTCCSR